MADIITGIFGVLILVGVIFGISLVRINTNNTGSHTGYVTAVETHGFFVKNYRVYFKTSKDQSQEDIYCIRDFESELADDLRKTSEESKEITIKYKGESGLGWTLCTFDRILSFTVKQD